MSDDKMRGALRAYCKGYEILPIHTMEEALDLWQAACATRDAEFINLHEVNRSLRDSNADMLRHFKSNEQQFAAANEKIKVALEALKHYTDVVVSINDPNDFTPKVSDAGNFAKEAITLLERRDGE